MTNNGPTFWDQLFTQLVSYCSCLLHRPLLNKACMHAYAHTHTRHTHEMTPQPLQLDNHQRCPLPLCLENTTFLRAAGQHTILAIFPATVVNTMTKSSLGKQRIILLACYRRAWKDPSHESGGRKEAETMEGHCLEPSFSEECCLEPSSSQLVHCVSL